ncbi:MAG: hypothetical protein HYR96_14000 [Deltaproteobacteria bacterium]|nr:hypothetical protein [Deltaproteobacteria bacterium]MBI3293907.1 hypothetical protein [Deltaproteobacteria bacterium]
MTNGNFQLIPERSVPLKYNVQAVNGKVQVPESSDKKDAYRISLNLVNGRVSSQVVD